MENFTNNTTVYFQAIEHELLKDNYTKMPILKYCEIEQRLQYGFSIAFYNVEYPYLLVKIWNASYDNKRFNLGIFNIDRLAITENKIELTPEKSKYLMNFSALNLEKEYLQNAVLDGRKCRLSLFGEFIIWNTKDEISDAANRFISDLISLSKIDIDC